MLSVNFFCLSICIIVGIASANPELQLIRETNGYLTDSVTQENPFPLLLQSDGALTGYLKSALSTAVDIMSWLASNIFYIITAAVISCRLSNLCKGPIRTVTQALTAENLEMAGRVLVPVMGNYYEGRN